MSTNFYDQIPLPDYEQLIQCMHCGLCLPTCPTYELTALEKFSPRGRIRMIKAVADGDMTITENFMESINFCLNCQACVTACPAGVQYGRLVEAAKLHIEYHIYQQGKGSRLKRFVLNWIFADLWRLQVTGLFMRLYQRIGLEKLIQKTGLLKIVSNKLHEMSYMAPPVPGRINYRLNDQVPLQKKNIRVGVLPGCVQEVFFNSVNQDTIDVLKINGYDVFVPRESYCCGSVHGHNGNLKMARILARKNIDLFEKAEVQYVVMNAAGCGAYMKDYEHLLHDDPEYAERALIFSKKVKDFSELLVEQGWLKPEGGKAVKVTYHEPCHLVHAQKVSQQPRQIIQSIPGIVFTELSEATWCCGSAGIYNIIRYDDSMRVLERKMKNIAASGARYVLTGNPGCMIQLIYGAKKFGVPVQILHPVTLLRQAYQK
jgi:glycolate oxidase iron-sulfur subunit